MEDLEDDSMREFLDELDLIPTPAETTQVETPTLPAAEPQGSGKAETTATADLDLDIDNILAETNADRQGDDCRVCRQKLPSSLSSSPKPVTPAAKPMKTKKPKASAKPKASRPAPIQIPTRDGSTMYERSRVQMEQREMKLKALQQQLMSDCTFTPKSLTPRSKDNSAEGSAEAVFDRLYATETASTRASRANTPKRGRTTTPRRARRRSNDSGLSAGSRVEALYEAGQKNLRAKVMTHKKEEESRRKRIEEAELAACTFTPRTKWQLATERRQKAREASEKAAEEEQRLKFKSTIRAEREALQKRREEDELKNCTFQPRTKWNIVDERRKLAGDPGAPWDDVEIPVEVMRTPAKQNGATPVAVSPLEDPVLSNKKKRDEIEKSYAQEGSGKNTHAPEVVRSNFVGSITPSTPEWREKYSKIGMKNQAETVITAEGHAKSETMQVEVARQSLQAGKKNVAKSPMKPNAKKSSPGTKDKQPTPKPAAPATKAASNTESVGGFKVAKKKVAAPAPAPSHKVAKKKEAAPAPAPSPPEAPTTETVGGFKVAKKPEEATPAPVVSP
eukprot:CAMPEP_0117044104 /NCGR_PEP_ID=MMETSP0472-20121206/30595_1 /TAXON_ID=693140 ORGANISM="Tiarina fusus, Strain LIS" /NCGR_SAMPLE_ID=MMETSP0472 /ASSEMBLY_ACC=CAM_ASM_000603 /LENGTH=562 /DNA_ID=CAMNT_0004755761 /DNA_START=226 /DNA_END=1911 /DNA_ORIENTATION=+